MNKKIIYIALFGLLMLVYSCETYEDIIPSKYNGILALKTVGEEDLTLYYTGEDATYDFTILKGGNKPSATIQAEIKILSEEELEKYSKEVGKGYTLLPSNMYEMKNISLNFSPTERYLRRSIIFKTNAINDLIEYDPLNYVLPVSLVSDTDSVNSEKELLLLKPIVVVPVVNYFVNSATVNVLDHETIYDFHLELPFESLWDFEVTIEIDESGVPGGSTLLSSDKYTIEDNGRVSFQKGNKLSDPLKITIKNTDLLGSGYVLPVKATSVSMSGFKTPKTNFMLYAAFNKVPLNVDMLSTNAQEVREGPIANLIDNNPATYFHSAHSFKIPDPHYFQLNLDEAITKCRFDYQNRNNANGKTIESKIMVSNNGTEWEELAHLNSGLPTTPGSTYSSKEYNASQPFKYFRFVVLKTNSGTAPTFFSLAEFYLYGK